MRHRQKLIQLFARAAVFAMLTAACGSVGGSTSTASSAAQTPPLAGQRQTPIPSGSVSDSSPGAQTPTAGAPSTPRATPSPSGITEEQAITAVQAFAPHASGLRVIQTETVAMGPAYRVQSADVVAEVDAATGQVTMFLDNAAMPTSAVIKITKDEALAAGTAWLAVHSVSTHGLTSTATVLDHGAIQEYEVVFQGRVNGARVPHRVEVSVDPATGAVYAFALYDRPFASPPPPALTPQAAASAARQEEQDPGAKVTSTDLAIDFDAAGTQVLVYELDLTRTDGFYVKVQVHALTGAVTVMGRG